jgi:hypothetical protein
MITKIRKLLVLANDPRTNFYEANTARRKALAMLEQGITRCEVDPADVMELLPRELFGYRGGRRR